MLRTPTAPVDLVLAAQAAYDRATSLARGSYHHGPAHWRCVSRYAVRLAHEAGGDPVVAFLFGALHDTQRLGEYSDPHHGLRAATVAQELFDEGLLPVNADQLGVLAYAIDTHEEPRPHPDPTVGACRDADRVTLWRVAVRPDARFMSTAAARRDPAMAYGDLMRDRHDWVQLAREACL